MPECDVCKLEFQSAKPNVAVVDAQIKGIGVWGYACQGHLSYCVPGTITKLEGVVA